MSPFRRVRFSVRALLLLTTVIAVALGMTVWRWNWYIRQAAALQQLDTLGLGRTYGWLGFSKMQPWRAWTLAKDTAREGHILSISSGDDRVFESLGRISTRKIFVSADDFDDEDLQRLVACSPAVQELVLRKSAVTNDGLKYVAQLSQLSHLSLGDLCLYPSSPSGDNNVWFEFPAAQFSDEALAIVEKLPNLERLTVVSPSLGNDQLRPLGRSGQLKTITLLSRQLSDGGLANLAAHRRLKAILLGGGQFSADGIKSLGALAELKHLGFKESQLDGPALVEIARLSSIETLALENTGVGNDDLRVLGGLPKLWNLYLAGRELDNGLLKSVQGWPRLAHLHLHETGVDDQGVADLIKLKLTEVFIHRKQLSPVARQQLTAGSKTVIYDHLSPGDGPRLFYTTGIASPSMHPDVPPRK